MAKIMEWNESQKKEWNEWLSGKPELIKKLANKYHPCNFYKLKTTGQRVVIHSYWEDGTVSVSITGKFNLVVFDKQVNGINLENLEECELPSKDEILGTLLTDEKEIEKFINRIPFDDKENFSLEMDKYFQNLIKTKQKNYG